MARQFDVFANPLPSREAVPYLLVVQHDFLDQTEGVLCAPLITADRFAAAQGGLNPIILVRGEPHVLAPDQMAPLPRRLLKDRVAHAGAERDTVARAIDLIFFGI